MNKKVIIVGDLHNQFSHLNTLINKKRPDLVLCCGDFGYWPNGGRVLSMIKTKGAKVLWCDGNHEDHWNLRNRKTDELAPNVFYMPRGSTYTLDDGRTIMFMGGADSIDKNMRTEGIDWFREEVIQQKDLYNLPDIKVDIFITHTCPVELVHTLRRIYEKDVEPSNHALSVLHNQYKPDLWFFGHWHTYMEGTLKGTKWFCLSYPRQGKSWWMYLPD